MLCSKCQQAAEGLTGADLCLDCHTDAESRRKEIYQLARAQHKQEPTATSAIKRRDFNRS